MQLKITDLNRFAKCFKSLEESKMFTFGLILEVRYDGYVQVRSPQTNRILQVFTKEEVGTVEE